MGVEVVAFVAVSLVVIVVPGVDFALVTRQVVRHGRRAGLMTAAGLLVGGLCHALFATVGLSALLLASAEAYTVVRLAGAAYLLWLGLSTLRSALSRGRRSAHDPLTGARGGTGPTGTRRSFVLGMLSDLLNVKVAVFFVTFLPQFVPSGPGAAWRTAFLGLLFNALASSWWVLYVLLIGRLQGWLRRPRVRRAVDVVTGTVLVGVGAGVAVER